MKTKLLLAEDTADLNRVVTVALEHMGYEVDSAFDGEEALNKLQSDVYDGVILDIMMPKMSGLEVLHEVREEGNNVPILLLTAKAEIDDRVEGLEAGADDYLTKPFAMKELIARVGAMTRRRKEYSDQKLMFEDISLDSDTFELKSENSVRLSVKEFELMQALIHSKGREMTSEYLIQTIWDNDEEAGEDTLWLYISYLRGKLRSIASNVEIIGEKGGCYRLVKD